MDLEDLAERLRHEMELITETELVLGPTAVSHFLSCRLHMEQLGELDGFMGFIYLLDGGFVWLCLRSRSWNPWRDGSNFAKQACEWMIWHVGLPRRWTLCSV